MTRPLILCSNDDGVNAPGLRMLVSMMEELGEVYAVAPETEQSGASHSFTLQRPLRQRLHAPRVFGLDGTPVDCVYVALCTDAFVPRRPDLVVAGINDGYNLGGDVFYSGTVAAAREGALRGVPSIAVSLAYDGDLDGAGRIARDIARRLLQLGPRPGPAPLLSVNIPRGTPKGLRAARLGVRAYEDFVEIRRDPRGRDYLWLGGPGVAHERIEGADTIAVDEGWVAVAPLRLELTEHEHMSVAAFCAGTEKP